MLLEGDISTATLEGNLEVSINILNAHTLCLKYLTSHYLSRQNTRIYVQEDKHKNCILVYHTQKNKAKNKNIGNNLNVQSLGND